MCLPSKSVSTSIWPLKIIDSKRHDCLQMYDPPGVINHVTPLRWRLQIFAVSKISGSVGQNNIHSLSDILSGSVFSAITRDHIFGDITRGSLFCDIIRGIMCNYIKRCGLFCDITRSSVLNDYIRGDLFTDVSLRSLFYGIIRCGLLYDVTGSSVFSG